MTDVPLDSSTGPQPSLPSDTSHPPAGSTRRERQHAEIRSAIHEGRTGHALDLAFEHLEEFGPDHSVFQMLASAVANQHDPALATEFEALLLRVGGQIGQRSGAGLGK
jgi:hypothetical protein